MVPYIQVNSKFKPDFVTFDNPKSINNCNIPHITDNIMEYANIMNENYYPLNYKSGSIQSILPLNPIVGEFHKHLDQLKNDYRTSFNSELPKSKSVPKEKQPELKLPKFSGGEMREGALKQLNRSRRLEKRPEPKTV